MEFFYQFFGKELHESEQGELHVCCPFPHTDERTGETYLENNPSAHINTEKSVFHCKVCGTGMSEVSFMMKLQGITYKEATQLLDVLKDPQNNSDLWSKAVQSRQSSEVIKKRLADLGIDTVADELQIGYEGEGIAFPVFIYGELLDVRTYRPNKQPKVMSRQGAKNLLLPFDLWAKDERPTLLCAGEKDMAIARAYGFNSLTFTGGEQAFPKLFKHSFKGKKIYICYDNDSAGFSGSRKVASILKEAGAYPYVVDISLVCAEKGEDIHDFFKKYGKTSEDLQDLLDITDPFSEADHQEERNKAYPLVSLEKATEPTFAGKTVSSRVSVVATFGEPMRIPDIVEIHKVSSGERCTISAGTQLTWYLDEEGLKDILYLCDSNLDEEAVKRNILKLVGIPTTEKFLSIRYKSYRSVWKVVVMDSVESEIMENDYKPSELVLYSLDNRLHSGEKYRIFYRTAGHPFQSQKIVAVTSHVEESDSSVNKFQVTDSVLDSLKCFQGNTEEKMKEFAERAKAIAGPETLPSIYWTVDLFYNTPLQFYFGKRLERAYLEPMIVGESRTGKSQTAKKMLEMYELGSFVTVKTSTATALIGGTSQSNGGRKTRLGIIPRNHKGAVILEEFSGGGKEFISKLTDVRSSHKVRIGRIDGDLEADAMVRMLSISNQQVGSNGQSIPLRQYPNGVKVLLDLIGAAEDVARYDFFVLVDKPKKYINPNMQVDLEPFPKESYMNRVRWAWSRKPEQVILDQDVRDYIVRCAEKLNERYDSHINFFGAEAWKKLARISIATAACVCSMDETGEKLVVKQEHVKWAANFFKECFDNKLFRLKEYVEAQRKYSECPPSAITALQGLYNKNATLVHQMEQVTELSQSQLKAVAGLTQDEFATTMNHLAECHFFVWNGDKIVPSERFREAASRINRNVYMKRVGSE